MLLTIPTIRRSIKDWHYIIIHHSWSNDHKVTSNWEGIKAYHLSRGWMDIGYHFGLEYVNNVLIVRIGRSLECAGAHTLGFNGVAVGICLIGNYDEQTPNTEQLDATAELCGILMQHYDIVDTKHILGHKEVYGLLEQPQIKTCPGTNFCMESLRERIKNYLPT